MLKLWRAWRISRLEEKIFAIDLEISHLRELLEPLLNEYILLGNDSVAIRNSGWTRFHIDLPREMNPLFEKRYTLREKRFRLTKKRDIINRRIRLANSTNDATAR